jgi:hypothetical protein
MTSAFHDELALIPQVNGYTLPGPAYRQGYYSNKCGYFGVSGPAHELPIESRQGTAVSYPCPYLATGGGIFYTAEQLQQAYAAGCAVAMPEAYTAGREAMREEAAKLLAEQAWGNAIILIRNIKP